MAENTTKQIKNEFEKIEQQLEESKKLQAIIADEQKPIYTIYKWEAPERIYEPKSKNWYVSIGTIAMGVIVISALTANFGLIFAVIALILFVYALNTIPPKQVTHEVTNKGMKTHQTLFSWKNVNGFWVMERGKNTIINMEVREGSNDPSFSRLTMLKGRGDINKIVMQLVRHADYFSSREAPTNIFERYTQGVYQPLIKYLTDIDEVITKDPKDKPGAEPPATASGQAKPAQA